MKFILGSDPELMLKHKATGQLVSAIPIIPEGKGRGRPLDKTGLNSVLHDNVLVEFNTKPARSEEEFVSTVGDVLQKIQSIVNQHGHDLHLQASAEFPSDQLFSEEARLFGCEPDFNAWNLDMNEVPAGAAEKPFRSAGGHLHIGMADAEDLNKILADDYGKIDVVKILDIFCGIPSVFLDKDPTSAARRSLYGGAGAHRAKPYGVEYRALGNWWLRSPEHTSLIYKLTKAALTALVQGQLPKLTKAIGQKKIQTIINQSKLKEARAAFNKHIKSHLNDELVQQIESLDLAEGIDFKASWGLG